VISKKNYFTDIKHRLSKKNGPRYNFAIDDPNEKKYTGNEIALKTLKTIIFILSTHPMGNFNFSNGNL
jgi:hypothetical protein